MGKIFAMALSLKRAFAVACAAALLTGCGKTHDIGAEAENPDLKGEVIYEEVFTGAPDMPHTRLSAQFLKTGQSYRVNGALTIDGNLPERVRLTVHNGELTINGNVGAQAHIEVRVPLVTHRQSYSATCMMYNAALKTSTPYPCTRYKTVVDGLRYDDPDPAIRVTGNLGRKATFETDGAVHVRARQVQAARYLPYRPAL
jgi:hypothetical protein